MSTLGRVYSVLSLTAALLTAALPAQAQLTTGTITGRILDPGGGAVPGAAVEAVNADSGFIRRATSDETGNYRLAALPVGDYQLGAEVTGFSRVSRMVVVSIARPVTLDITLGLPAVSVGLVVSASLPLVSTTSSSVGDIVPPTRIEHLPLNGRQFANLAATIPGVGLGFHSDVTKSAQYTPQISGGNGRNVNYVVDGGDNNDDTVGGLLQLFPLEAIQEFTVLTQRFDAEYGRSNGAVLNVVTKSGTNQPQGSWFTLFRDDALNGKTLREERNQAGKQPYARYQFGGSTGGPIVENRAHYFAAYERTQQDTRQIVDTLGLFPSEDGIFDVPFRQNLLTAKVTGTARPGHDLALRYASDRNSQPSGAGPNAAYSSWTTSTNSFDSVNVNYNWVVNASSLNEVVFQYSGFVNDIPVSVPGASYRFANTVFAGANRGAPQRTEQRKWQLRDDFSRTLTGRGGLAHELRGGINWIHEPRLFVKTAQGTAGLFGVLTLDRNGPVTDVTFIGGNPEANFPLDMYGLYAQDNWRVSNRLTLNLGLRWDYVDGFPIDQSASANFLAMQAAGRTGRFAGTLLEDFGQPVRSDRDNIQPRLGAVLDLRGDGGDIIRGGWGIYTDFGYINSNVLTAAFDTVGAGPVFSVINSAGIRKADGTLFTLNDPIETISHLNTVAPGGFISAGEVGSPLLEQPYTRQANLGWAHQLNGATAVTADYVRVDGRDLNLRLRPNALVGPGQRLLDGIPISPANRNFRTAMSKGRSKYNALIVALRRRLSSGFDLTASYTLSESLSDVGSASDELVADLLQEVRDPFAAVQLGPSTRTDARHQVTLSTVIQAPWAITVAPIVFYRSALPVHTFEGVDVTADGVNNDKTALRYAYTGINAAGVATFTEDGRCETVNCSRRAPFSQVNLKVSKGFRLARTRVEAIAEIFNLFNAKNPSLSLTQARQIVVNGTPVANLQFMQPLNYAGDVGQPEQRVGQLGFRVSF
jgi:outer membrane receptor protein involved in Fe transport